MKKLEPWQNPNIKPYIQLDHVTKSFDGIQTVAPTTLDIYRNEFFSILGPSGCGKTTLLRLLAGFETPDTGKITISNINMTSIPPYDRPVNMMFQSYALFPHMSVEQNVAFGLRQDKSIPRHEIRDRVHNALKLVRMHAYLHRRPHQLSGGQRQRVALARSLIKRPKLLLLDEPLAALDKKLRQETQFELVNIQEKVGITFIMVTHDQEEAMTMSTRIAIMEEGRVRQVGTPQEIYEFPNSRYVADFVGNMNIFEGVILETHPDHALIRCQDTGCDMYINYSGAAPEGAQVAVAIRPEKIMMNKTPPQGYALQNPVNVTRGLVQEIGYLGDMSIYYVELESGKQVLATMPNLVRVAERPINWGDKVYLYWRPENGIILTA